MGNAGLRLLQQAGNSQMISFTGHVGGGFSAMFFKAPFSPLREQEAYRRFMSVGSRPHQEREASKTVAQKLLLLMKYPRRKTKILHTQALD